MSNGLQTHKMSKVRRPAKHTRDNRETPTGYTSDHVNMNTDGDSNDTSLNRTTYMTNVCVCTCACVGARVCMRVCGCMGVHS